MEETDQEHHPKHSKKRFVVFITIFCLVIAILSAIGWYFTQQQDTEIDSDVGFLFSNNKDGRSYIYNFGKDKVIPLEDPTLTAGNGSGSVCSGSDLPTTSPDGKKTALLDTKSRNLYIISNSDGTAEKITDTGNITYIASPGWTADSTKIIYFIQPPFDFEDPNPESGRFLMYDLKTKKTKELTGLSCIEEISTNKILAKEGSQYYWYDIETGKNDKGNFLVSYENNGFHHQVDLNSDATKWAFTKSYTESDTSEITYADIGKLDGQTLAQGTFAQYQRPQLSPNNSKIAFSTEGGFRIFDLKKKRFVNPPNVGGFPTWIDNNNILISGYRGDEQFNTYYIWNIPTNKVKEINPLIPKDAYETVNTDIFPQAFESRTTDINSIFQDATSIPYELTDEYNNNLLGITCQTFTDPLDTALPITYASKYSNLTDYRTHEVKDADILTVIEKSRDLSTFNPKDKDVSDSVKICKLEDGRLYLERAYNELTNWAPHAFMFSTPQSEPIYRGEASFNELYGGCGILQIDKNNTLYFSCSAGDGGWSSHAVKKITSTGATETILACSSNVGKIECTIPSQAPASPTPTVETQM